MKNFDLRWYPEPALTVVMAAKGYPGDYKKGTRIDGLDDAAKIDGVEIFHAGTVAKDGAILANGGRVLNVCAMGKTVTRGAGARLSGGRSRSTGPTASAAATSPGRRWRRRRADAPSFGSTRERASIRNLEIAQRVFHKLRDSGFALARAPE